MTTPRKEKKRDARRLEKAEKAALIDKVTVIPKELCLWSLKLLINLVFAVEN